MAIAWRQERELIAETARELVERGLVIGKAGNVSLRLPAQGGKAAVTITPTSRYYEAMSAEDVPVVAMDGRPLHGRLAPSSELALHLGIYRARPNVNAVIHTHSTYASAVAVAGLDIPALLEEEVAFLGGGIKVAGYAPSGTQELADNAVAALGERNAVLLASHGAVGVGRSMREALNACDLLEKASKIFLITMAVGKVSPLPPEAVASARALFLRLQASEDL